MSKKQVDLTWRTDGGGTPILSQRSELILNKIEMLLNMVPGKDPRDPERGLNVRSRITKSYVDPTRDTSFESELTKQISKYTDIKVAQAMVVRKDKLMFIYLSVTYQGESFLVDIQVDESTLTSQLRNPDDTRII